MQYVGKTEREFRTRVKEHVRYIENGNVSQATGQHFSQRKFADDFSPIIKSKVLFYIQIGQNLVTPRT